MAPSPEPPTLPVRPLPPRQLRRTHPGVLASVAAGGMVGASARYGLSRVLHVAPNTFPWATFWTNVVGAFALGVVMIVLTERIRTTPHARTFGATGVIGAFTTMSTFEVETVTLLGQGHPGLGITYGVASVAAGLVAAYVGVRLIRALPHRSGTGAGR